MEIDSYLPYELLAISVYKRTLTYKQQCLLLHVYNGIVIIVVVVHHIHVMQALLLYMNHV